MSGDFRTEVFCNPYLPVTSAGEVTVEAIVRVQCLRPPTPTQSERAEILLIDCSGSMAGESMAAAIQAAQASLAALPDGIRFAVIGGNHLARAVYPPDGLAVLNDHTRAEAARALAGLRADGGTALGTWLRAATALAEQLPVGARAHAVLLTDGVNEHETPDQLGAAIDSARGVLECDCRGVGDRWQVEEVRPIAAALLGTVGLVRSPADLVEELDALIRDSVTRSSTPVDLDLWLPQGAGLLFFRQVFPTLLPLSTTESAALPERGRPTAAPDLRFRTAAWKTETRDYHLAVRLPGRSLGEEQLAARVKAVEGEKVLAQALVTVRWSADPVATSRVDEQVEHYSRRASLAQAIQGGLAAKERGRSSEATTLLRRAVSLAATVDEEATARLRKLVEVDSDGTVQLRRSTDRLDEMELDVASTRTARLRRSAR